MTKNRSWLAALNEAAESRDLRMPHFNVNVGGMGAASSESVGDRFVTLKHRLDGIGRGRFEPGQCGDGLERCDLLEHEAHLGERGGVSPPSERRGTGVGGVFSGGLCRPARQDPQRLTMFKTPLFLVLAALIAAGDWAQRHGQTLKLRPLADELGVPWD